MRPWILAAVGATTVALPAAVKAQQYYGWNLPGDDQERFRSRLGELDALVDEIRDEQ
jgi:hypothetical protein